MLKLREYPEFDSIRFLAIALVILHHQFFTQNQLLAWFAEAGWVGVDIFFVMSGYLITNLLIKEFEQSSTINLKAFWVKRIIRLWPSLYLTLFITVPVVLFLARLQPETLSSLSQNGWHYFFHFGNYSHAYLGKIHTLFSHFWSLAVEEHFYFVWPIAILFILKKKKLRLPLLLLLFFLPLLMRYFHLKNNDHLFIINLTTHTRFDELIAGCALSFLMPKIRPLNVVTEIVLSLCMLWLFYLGLHEFKVSQMPLLHALTYTSNAMASVILLILALKGTEFGFRSILKISFISKLGILSYGVYLIHFIMNFLIFGLNNRIFKIQDQNILAIINLSLPFIPAYFMYRYIDYPLHEWRKKLKI